MKKLLFFSVCLFTVTAAAVELPIVASKTGFPRAFSSNPRNSKMIVCSVDASGKCVIKMDAQEKLQSLLSGTRVKLAEKDKVKIMITGKGKGSISFGMHIYDSNKANRFIGSVYQREQKVNEKVTQYSFEGVVPKNPREKSSFDRPGIGLVFIQVKKGGVFQVEKIHYEIVKAPEEKVEIPEF